MALTTEQRLQGVVDWDNVDITLSHSLLTPQTVENREYDRHLVATNGTDRQRDYYITNSGIIPIDPCIMPGCNEPRLNGPGCNGRCAQHIDRCVGHPRGSGCTERATVMQKGRPNQCRVCKRNSRR
jgi:hypothetical protein